MKDEGRATFNPQPFHSSLHYPQGRLWWAKARVVSCENNPEIGNQRLLADFADERFESLRLFIHHFTALSAGCGAPRSWGTPNSGKLINYMPTLDPHLLQASDTIEQIIHWIREAGQVALHYFDNVGPAYKPDRTLVTQADLEVEHLLAERIGRAFPTHSFIGEESVREAPTQLSDIVWVIDPIDGTTAYSQGLPGWGIAIGVLHAGKPLLGFYYMPLLDDLTYTSATEVFCNGRRLRHTLRDSWRQKGFLALSARAHYDYSINVRHSRALGSNGTNLVYTARGSAMAAFLPKAHVWDLVAGAAIVERLGGELRYLDGTPVNYEALLDGRLAPQPVIAGHARVLATLADAIQLKQDSA